MMQLVENIATRQTEVDKQDWFMWCARLEQTLLQATESLALAAFKRIGLNPLSPMFEKPFRPAFAELDVSQEAQRYVDALRRVEQAWGVAGLQRMGGTS
jgi:hypothetical protein